MVESSGIKFFGDFGNPQTQYFTTLDILELEIPSARGGMIQRKSAAAYIVWLGNQTQACCCFLGTIILAVK